MSKMRPSQPRAYLRFEYVLTERVRTYVLDANLQGPSVLTDAVRVWSVHAFLRAMRTEMRTEVDKANRAGSCVPRFQDAYFGRCMRSWRVRAYLGGKRVLIRNQCQSWPTWWIWKCGRR